MLGLPALLVLAAGAPLVRSETIKIMSANITSGNYQAYEGPGIRIFQALKPDVVMIQEFNYESGSLRDFVDEAFGPEYYYMVEPHSGGIPNGVISRWPIYASGQWNDSYVTDRDFAWAKIDLPGDKDLQVVSVHLKGTKPTTQYHEAELIKTNVANNFDNDQYIVVGGDLNTTNRTQSAITTFKTFLDADDHTPVDRNGDAKTNAGRKYDYDWVMPNHTLDECHTTLHVGTADRAYTQGIVFDSHVCTPLTEVTPVQYADSHVTGMQHMAVMKAYNLPMITPTPSPTPHYIINEEFDDFQNGQRPYNWTFTNCNQDSDTYTGAGNYGDAPPSIKFDAQSDAVTTRAFYLSSSESLTFWSKGMSAETTTSLLVEEFYDSDWKTVTNLTELPLDGTTLGPFPLCGDTTRVKVTFSTQTASNLAFDDLRITGPVTPLPTPTIPTPTPTATIVTPTPGISPMITATPTPTANSIFTPSPTASPSPSPSPSTTPSPSSSPSP